MTDVDEPWPESTRRPRKMLEWDVLNICKAWVAGEVELDEDKHMTPYHIAGLIQTVHVLDTRPSIGAVHRILLLWDTYGFAVIHKGPIRFISFTPEADSVGLDELRKRHKARLVDEAERNDNGISS